MDNAVLKKEADQLVRRCNLPKLLAGYPDWFIGGSYSYDLMCWRDLDIYILDRVHDLKQCFAVGYEVTLRLAAKKSRFTNNLDSSGPEPNGFYWGIKLGDILRGAWKLDIWFLTLEDYTEHRVYSEEMRRKLDPESRRAILEIKQVYWQHPAFRDTITSDRIYRSVFENGVTGVRDFEQFLSRDLARR